MHPPRWLIVVSLLVTSACRKEEEEQSPAPQDTSDSAPVVSVCEAEGWTQRAFLTEGAFGSLRRDLAGDFTVPTTPGDWVFSEQFTGCESYVFIPDSLEVSPLDSTPLLESRKDLKDLLKRGPKNVHYFFLSTASERAQVNEFAEDMQGRIDGVADSLAKDADWWREHLHVVTKGVPKIKNWVGDAMTSTGQGFAIDRFQRIRGFGGLADVTRQSSELNAAGAWPWEANLAYLAHEALYYNHESDRQDMLDAVEWTVVYLFYEENVASNGRSRVWVDLPDAATMATFDTLLVDLTHACDPAREEFGNCDAWDAVQSVVLCQPDEPDTCDIELARYITTYHREGRWLADNSQLLPYLRDGGRRRLQLSGARGGHFNSVRLLLADSGKGFKPYQIEHLWQGGSWDDNYNDNHPPIQVDVPGDAKQVFLQVTVTGHGMSSEHNCAEFCDHHHIFEVGGGEFIASHPDMGDIEGCLKQIDKGTVPNQHGTWWYERSSWCPGKQVDPWVFDITDQVVPGQSAEISYRTNHGNPAFGGSILLHSWVSYWR